MPITIMPPVTTTTSSRTSPAPPAAFGAVTTTTRHVTTAVTASAPPRPAPSAPPAVGVVSRVPRGTAQQQQQVHRGVEVDTNYEAAQFPPSYEEIMRNPPGAVSKAKAALVCNVCNNNVVYSLLPEPPELVICPHCNEATVVTTPKDKEYLRCPAPCSCLIAYERDATNVLCPRCHRVLDTPPPLSRVGVIPAAASGVSGAASTHPAAAATSAERRPLTERMHVDDSGGGVSRTGAKRKVSDNLAAGSGASVSILRPNDADYAGSTTSSDENGLFAGIRIFIFLILGVSTLVLGIGLFIGLGVGGLFAKSPLWILMPSGLVVAGLFMLAVYFVVSYCL